jgi:lambda family phage portal protein
MGMFSWFKRSTATAPPRRRGFDAASTGRLMSDWITSNTSLDVEIRKSLKKLRERSRDMVRNNDHARNAVRIIVNNVIGPGVQMQALVKQQRGGKLNAAANEAIEDAWKDWCRLGNCHTGGTLAFKGMERLIMRTVVIDGESFIRKVPKFFGKSKVPFALELISADRVDVELNFITSEGNEVRMGVERDAWARPVAYYVDTFNEADTVFGRGVFYRKKMRIPASEMFHLFHREHIDQTRGVPWFASAILRLHHLQGYTEAEVIAARAEACRMGFITSPDDEAGQDGTQADGTPVQQYEPGAIMRLLPGEVWNDAKPSRPGGQFEPFTRMMLRSMAAGIGVSYASLSRDYSQSNYSSSRLSILDDRDEWRQLQAWYVEHFREPLHPEWMEWATLAGQLALFGDYENRKEFYQRVKFIPRGWSWVDPTKEIAAFKDAVRSGFATQAEIIAQNGGDLEELLEARADELAQADALGLVFDTDPRKISSAGQQQQPAAADPAEDGDTTGETAPGSD